MKEEAGHSTSRGMVGQSNTLELQESAAVFEKRVSNIVSFADMGLNTPEIQIALVFTTREDVSNNEINSILATAITKGKLQKRKFSGEFEASSAEGERVNKVLRRLIARKMLPEEKAKMIHGKEEWDRVDESMGNIDKPMGIVKKLIGRGAVLSDAMQIAKLERTPTEDPIIRLAQELAADDEIIPSERFGFDQVILICNQNKIKVPQPVIPYIIVFEGLLKARQGIKTSPQDLMLINRYHEKRDMFFNEENESPEEIDEESESIIIPKLSYLEARIIELEDCMVFRTDEAGIFRPGKNGLRYREPVQFDDNGFIIFDNTDRFIRRAKSRDRIVGSWQDSSSTKAQKAVALWEMNNPLDAKH